MPDENLSFWRRTKALWSGYGQADTALSFIERTGLSRLLWPFLVSGGLTTASFFTEWANAFGPLGIALTAIGGFILGCIALVGLETLKLKRAERFEVQSRNPKKHPEFGLVLRGGSAFNPGETTEVAGVAASVLIWNTGDPTHIVEWSLVISVGDISYKGQYSNVNPNGMSDAQTGHKIVSWEETFEARRTAIGEEPIDCVVVFFFRAPLQDLIGPLAIWHISFSDIYGNTCSAEFKPGGGITGKDLK